MPDTVVVGIISDTHRMLPEQVLDVFSGRFGLSQVVDEVCIDGAEGSLPTPGAVDLVIHAGDIGELDPVAQYIIDQLETVAPVRAVLGNRDIGGYTASGEPVTDQLLELDVAGVTIAIMHKAEDLDAALRRKGAKPRVQIYGHIHEPKVRRIGRRLLLCPGAVSRPRGDWPQRTVALLYLAEPGQLLGVQIVRL